MQINRTVTLQSFSQLRLDPAEAGGATNSEFTRQTLGRETRRVNKAAERPTLVAKFTRIVARKRGS